MEKEAQKVIEAAATLQPLHLLPPAASPPPAAAPAQEPPPPLWSLLEDRHETETLYLFNKKMLHLVDDIFWNMGFHNSERQDKVPIICTYCSYCNY